MQTYHETRDAGLLAALTADMANNGWIGSPLVAWGENLITGSHRYAAARSLGWDDSDIPTVQIADLAAECGEDFDAICEDEGCDDIESAMLVYVLDRCVTPQVRDEYGIDIH